MYIDFVFIFIFNLIDLIFGLLKTVKNKDFKSGKMKKGIIEKSYILLLFWVFIFFEQFAKNYNINMLIVFMGIKLSISKFYSFFTILNQISSIFENISKTYPKILPSKIIDIFDKIN